MPVDYSFAHLPLDAPDDDPRWRGWTEAVRLAFHDGRASEADVRRTRDFSRSDRMRLRGVWTDRPGLPAHTPVATFISCDKTINVGHGRTLDVNAITDVTVRGSDRRQGLLRRQMLTDLTEAAERGLAFSALTATEGAIYNRFGFDVATRVASVRVDTRRWTHRNSGYGRFELVPQADLGPHLSGVWDTIHAERRSSVARFAKHRGRTTGEDPNDAEQPETIRALLHYDENDDVDGYAVYRFLEWDPVPRAEILEIESTHPLAEAAIWEALASLDLVTFLEYRFEPVEGTVQRALADPRAMKVTGIDDLLWLRILDPVQALAERGWDADGTLVLRIDDPLELADGTFQIDARDGRARVTRTEKEADLRLGVDTLAAVYFGTTPIALLAAAGRVKGSDEAVREGTRLFSVLDLPHNTVGF